MKPLTKKGVLKRHKQNPKDKDLHKAIETRGIKRSDFSKIILLSLCASLIISASEVVGSTFLISNTSCPV